MATAASVVRRVSGTKKKLLNKPEPVPTLESKPLPKLSDLISSLPQSKPSPYDTWDPKKQPYGGSYGSTVHMEKLAQMQAAQQPQSNDVDRLSALLQQQMMGTSGGNLEAQVAAAVSGEFDPQIAALQKDIAGAKKRGAGAKNDLKALYADLSGYYEGKVKPTKAMYKVAKNEASQRTKSLKQSITDDYTARLKEQVDMYKQLGIEAAAKSATEGQYSDQASQLAVADNQGNAMQNALQQEEVGDVGYWSEGAGIAKQEGAEAQTDIQLQLNDYLNKQGAALAGLQGQKKAAYNSSLMKAQSDSQGDLWDKMVQLAKLKQAAGSGSGGKLYEGLTGAVNMLGGDQRLANFFQEALSAATVWGNSAQAKSYYGGQAPNSPEEWAQVIRDHAANQGLSPADQLKLWQAALTHFGRLK